MNRIVAELYAMVGAGLMFPNVVAAAGCETDLQRTNWVNLLGRGLHNHDPEHAAQMTKEVGGGGTILDLIAGSLDPTDQAIAQDLRAHGGLSKLRPMLSNHRQKASSTSGWSSLACLR